MRYFFPPRYHFVCCVLFLLGGWSVAYWYCGIVRPPNVHFFVGALGLLFSVCLWVNGIVAMIDARRAAAQEDSVRRWDFVFGAISSFFAPLVLFATWGVFRGFGELRDVRRVGLETLRSEAAGLVAANQPKP